jgi:sugar fermentation stimulation protein A
MALVPASFVSRPNRFIVRATLRDGNVVEAHLADPGRLVELLIPGASLRLRPAPEGGARRTRFSVALVRASEPPRAWVSVETQRANRLAEDLLSRGEVFGVGREGRLRREVREGDSRFDFLLDGSPRGRLWIEVKSVTLVENGVGRFPDAPTDRGTRHLRGLTSLVERGDRAMVLFVAQREDAERVTAHRRIDPVFADTLAVARGAGVMLRAARFRFDANGRALNLGPIPVRP